jgi:long-chain fatty acid transport protein
MSQSHKHLAAGALLAALQITSSSTQAANFGTDLNLTMMPAAGGMGGVGIARPQDLGASVFGNPATLTQFKGTQFMFGATFYDVDVEASHDGSTSGTPWSADSDAGPYLVPNVAVTQSLSDATVLGAGLTVVSGVGSDFRGVPGSLDPLAEILVFGANAGIAHRINDRLSIGAMATIGMGLGQAGLNGNTASTSNFGFRGTLGATYETGPTTLGAYYRSPLSIKYDNMVQYAPNGYHSPTFEQPQELGFGIANESLMGGDLLLAADLVWKDWSGAESYQDLYDDQYVYAIGAQYSTGPYRFRAGYTHADSPIKSNVGSNVGSITSLLVGGMTVPMNPALTQYVQATNAEVIWEDQVSLGFGMDLTKTIMLDAHTSYALKRDEQIGATSVDAGAWQAGIAFTWRFD